MEGELKGEIRGLEPLLRWAGSKRQLRTCLAQYWKPSFERYVEPFAGSSCLFFWLRPNRALLSDKNSDLIDFYRTLAKDPDGLFDLVSSYPRNRASYYGLRSLHPATLAPGERAARFLFLNRHCFNGIYRTDQQGRFNVPYSPSKTGALPSLEAFRACAQLLRSVTLRARDFGSTLRHTHAGDFVYLDPPYATARRRVFTEYGARPFHERDLQRLAAHLRSLDTRGVAFVLSYADCPEVRKIGTGWSTRTVFVRRNVAGFQDRRRRAREVIISNIKVE